MSSAMLPEGGGGGRRKDLKDFQRNCGALLASLAVRQKHNWTSLEMVARRH